MSENIAGVKDPAILRRILEDRRLLLLSDPSNQEYKVLYAEAKQRAKWREWNVQDLCFKCDRDYCALYYAFCTPNFTICRCDWTRFVAYTVLLLTALYDHVTYRADRALTPMVALHYIVCYIVHCQALAHDFDVHLVCRSPHYSALDLFNSFTTLSSPHTVHSADSCQSSIGIWGSLK